MKSLLTNEDLALKILVAVTAVGFLWRVIHRWRHSDYLWLPILISQAAGCAICLFLAVSLFGTMVGMLSFWFIAASALLAWNAYTILRLHPPLRTWPVIISLVPIAAFLIVSPRVDHAMRQQATMEIVDDDGRTVPIVSIEHASPGGVEARLAQGIVELSMPYHLGNISLTVFRADGKKAFVGLQRVGDQRNPEISGYQSGQGINGQDFQSEGHPMIFRIKALFKNPAEFSR